MLGEVNWQNRDRTRRGHGTGGWIGALGVVFLLLGCTRADSVFGRAITASRPDVCKNIRRNPADEAARDFTPRNGPDNGFAPGSEKLFFGNRRAAAGCPGADPLTGSASKAEALMPSARVRLSGCTAPAAALHRRRLQYLAHSLSRRAPPVFPGA
jgi:hypothetical protein